MILSTKLLVATLGVSHFSGAVASKEERDQLRRNLRQGERKAQFVFEPDPSMDDYFDLSEGVEDVGIQEVDDFFKDTDSGVVFDWDAAGVHSHDEVEHAHEYEGSHDHKSYSGKASKTTKIGKMMWDETPIMTKGKKDKAMKGLKNLKGSKGSLLTKASATKSMDYYSSPSGDSYNARVDEFESSDGWLSAFEPSSSLGYSDLFETTAEVQQRNDFADPKHVTSSEFKAKGGSTLMSGRMEGPEAPAGRMTFDDDFFNDEEPLVFLPRPTVTVGGSLFSVNPQTIVPPVVPDGSGNTLTLGTEYLFNEVMTNAQDIGSQITPVDVDDQQVLFIVALDGICDRIGPADQNSVQGYCFFTYTFIDPATSLTGGSFTAQGIIVNSQVPGQLTVTGGTGILTGASGLVEILPADVDQNVNPPELVQPAPGIDPFNEVAGWAHFFEFDVDVLFFLEELYAR